MTKNFFLLLCAFILSLPAGRTQEIWSLEKCITYAKDNSIAIKQAQLGVANATLTEKANQMARLPNLNATISGGAQFGYTIDPVTNDFSSQTIGFNNWQLNSGVTLFAGNRINNSIKQARTDAKAAELDGENTANNLMLNVAAAYLNILMAEETYQNTLTRKKLSEQQLERTDKLIRAGTLPENDRLNILSQLALDEQAVIQAQNSVDIGYLTLKNLLQVEPGTEFKITKPVIEVPDDANPDLFVFEIVYSAALGTQPSVQAAELREKSAELGVNIAESTLFPTISAFGGIDSRWSSVSKDFNNPTEFMTVDNEVEVEFGGVTETIIFKNEVPVDFPDISYFDQLQENLGQNLGAAIQIPIYSNYNNRANIERAKLNVINAQLSAEQVRQQLQSDVQTAIANARAARKTYQAARLALDAAEMAYDNADKRYQLGAVSTFDYTNSRTNLDAARIEVIRAKYDYIFRLKIVDFYTGKDLKF